MEGQLKKVEKGHMKADLFQVGAKSSYSLFKIML